MEHRRAPMLLQAMDSLLDIVLRRDYEPFALGLAAFRIGWGLLLLMPWRTFDSTPSFRYMEGMFAIPQDWVLGRQVVPSESIWGLLMVLMALVHVYGILLDKPGWRSWGSLLGIGSFVWVAVLVGVANPAGTGWWTYGCLALFALFCWLRFYLDWKTGVRP